MVLGEKTYPYLVALTTALGESITNDYVAAM